MNTLSWVFYGMDVIITLKSVAEAIAISTAAAAAIFGAIALKVAAHDEPEPAAKLWGYSKRFIVAFFAFLAITVITPSERTIYMIVASELGETVVQNEEVQDIFDRSKRILMKKLDELEKDE